MNRLLSNRGTDVWGSVAHHDQCTLALQLVTGHGRTQPLRWLTVWKAALTKQRNNFEYACLARLADLVPVRLNTSPDSMAKNSLLLVLGGF